MSAPEGYHTITPWLISRDTAGLIDYLKECVDAVELGRMTMDDGSIGHAELRIGDSVVMLFDARPEWPRTPGFLRIYVDDADETHRRMVAAGGTSVSEITHMAWGDRAGRVRDPHGHLWWIMARVEDVAPEEVERRMSDPAFTAAMQYMQSAKLVV